MGMITDTHYAHEGHEELVSAIVCETCEKNSQEGSGLFNLKGALAHNKKYGTDTTHNEFREIVVQAEFVATEGGYVEDAGLRFD